MRRACFCGRLLTGKRGHGFVFGVGKRVLCSQCAFPRKGQPVPAGIQPVPAGIQPGPVGRLGSRVQRRAWESDRESPHYSYGAGARDDVEW